VETGAKREFLAQKKDLDLYIVISVAFMRLVQFRVRTGKTEL